MTLPSMLKTRTAWLVIGLLTIGSGVMVYQAALGPAGTGGKEQPNGETKKDAEKGKVASTFDAVILVEGKEPQISLLFVVLTQPKADNDKLNELVARHAKAAIQVASEYQFEGTTKPDEKPKYRGNAVFFVRLSTKARNGYATGFGVEQLREIAALNLDEGKERVRHHTWGWDDLPVDNRREGDAGRPGRGSLGMLANR